MAGFLRKSHLPAAAAVVSPASLGFFEGVAAGTGQGRVFPRTACVGVSWRWHFFQARDQSGAPPSQRRWPFWQCAKPGKEAPQKAFTAALKNFDHLLDTGKADE